MEKKDIEKIRGRFEIGSRYRINWRHRLDGTGIEVRIGKRWMEHNDLIELLDCVDFKQKKIIDNWPAMMLEEPEDAYGRDISYLLDKGSTKKYEINEDELDEWELIRYKGKLIAEQEWDSGGQAGGGVVSVYEFKGKYHVDTDAGMFEYDTREEAMLQVPENEATVSMWESDEE